MQNEIYIGADTALTTHIDGKNKRVCLPDNPVVVQKIFSIGDMMIYCGGQFHFVPPTIKYLEENPNITNDDFLDWLNANVEPHLTQDHGFTVILCSLSNGKSLVRGFDSLGKGFTHYEHPTPDNIMVIVGGNKTPEIREAATKLLIDINNTGDTINNVYIKAFEKVSCNKVGGSVYLYAVSNKAVLLDNQKLNESDIDYFYINTLDQIKVNAITSQQIQAGSIGANEIAANSIIAGNIAANSILSHHIGAGQIIAINIGANAIQADHIAAGTITADRIGAGTLPVGVVYAGQIEANQINAGTLNAMTITGGTISGTQINGVTISGSTLTGTDINALQIVAQGLIVGDIPVSTTLQNLQQRVAALENRQVRAGSGAANHTHPWN